MAEGADAEYYIIEAKYGTLDLATVEGDIDLTDSFNQQLAAGTRDFAADQDFMHGTAKVLMIKYFYKGHTITEVCKNGESIHLPAE